MEQITRRHRIGSIEKILNIRANLHIRDYNNPGNTTFKVSRLIKQYPYGNSDIYESIGESFVYDNLYTKKQLIEEANLKLLR